MHFYFFLHGSFPHIILQTSSQDLLKITHFLLKSGLRYANLEKPDIKLLFFILPPKLILLYII